jgi:hypothetical protein
MTYMSLYLILAPSRLLTIVQIWATLNYKKTQRMKLVVTFYLNEKWTLILII